MRYVSLQRKSKNIPHSPFMDLEKQLQEIEAYGNEHIGSSSRTPLRPDAFAKDDQEKMDSIEKMSAIYWKH